jgi:chromosome segregation ATPase
MMNSAINGIQKRNLELKQELKDEKIKRQKLEDTIAENAITQSECIRTIEDKYVREQQLNIQLQRQIDELLGNANHYSNHLAETQRQLDQLKKDKEEALNHNSKIDEAKREADDLRQQLMHSQQQLKQTNETLRETERTYNLQVKALQDECSNKQEIIDTLTDTLDKANDALNIIDEQLVLERQEHNVTHWNYKATLDDFYHLRTNVQQTINDI